MAQCVNRGQPYLHAKTSCLQRQRRPTLLLSRVYLSKRVPREQHQSHCPPCGFQFTFFKPLKSVSTRGVAASSAPEAKDKAHVEVCDALIVGMGPGGLGTALLLARHQKQWERIIVLEKRPSVETASKDADLSYPYGITWRGLALTDAAGLTPSLEAVSVTKNARLKRVTPEGRIKEIVLPTQGSFRVRRMQRRALLTVLQRGLAEAELRGQVRLMNNVQVTNIQLSNLAAAAAPGTPPPPIVVHAHDAASGRTLAFAPRLLIGADGIRSEVRQALESWAPRQGLPADHFSPVLLNSPSAGLRFKTLLLRPNPPFRRRADTAPSGSGSGSSSAGLGAVLENSSLVLLEGVRACRTRAMLMGLFPVADPSAPRPATFVARADHVFWSLNTSEQLRDFLQESFPQLDIAAVIEDQDLERAAAARSGVFPRPQYLRHFTAVLPQATAAPPPAPTADASPAVAPAAAAADLQLHSGRRCGVALVGDAVHCFPPDLGQGVNSTADDVIGLVQALDESEGDLERALPLYEARRALEAAALAELSTFGSPYQYNQDKLGMVLWLANVQLRKTLSALVPWAFAPQATQLLQRTMLSYAEIRDRVHATTRRIWALAGVLVAALAALAVKAKAVLAPVAASGVVA